MAPASRGVVRLTNDQRRVLDRLVRTGSHPAARRRRAAILLKADADGPDGWTDGAITEHLDTSRMAVQRVRPQSAAEGPDATLRRKRPTGRQYRKPDGAPEARLAAPAGPPAPGGRGRRTMTLLADKLVELAVAESIDPATVRRTLKETTSGRGPSSCGSSRPTGAGRSSPPWKT